MSWTSVGLRWAPISTRLLADFGATVVKVESAEWPDALRTAAPFRDNQPGLDRSGMYALYSCNKYSLALNLEHPRSKDIIWKLVEWADVVAENFGAGTLDRRGFSYDEIRKVKPEIIMIRSSNQGQTGPHARDGGFGSHVLALSGLGHISGWPDRLPSHVSIGYVDVLGGFTAIMAVLAALDYRRRTGKGQCIDMSQLESVIPLMEPLVLDWTANGRDFLRAGNRSPYAAPHDAYPCRGDDSWCVIAVFSDEEWKALCCCMGDPQRATDPRFDTLLGRKQNEDELDRLVAEWTSARSAEEVMTTLPVRWRVRRKRPQRGGPGQRSPVGSPRPPREAGGLRPGHPPRPKLGVPVICHAPCLSPGSAQHRAALRIRLYQHLGHVRRGVR